MRGDGLGQAARLTLAATLLAGLGACVPSGGNGGGGGGQGGADAGVEADVGPALDMAVDPDDGVPHDMAVDPDDGVPPRDMAPPGDGGCAPAAERCNGVDDDCDGEADEDFPMVGAPCAVGEGFCEAEGVAECAPDGAGVVCSGVAGAPADELCNGIDDDCDGDVDEVEPTPCETGAAGRCAEGLTLCVGGGPACVPRSNARAELCDGVDDDCDGTVDEDAAGGEPCDTGLAGRCAEGALVCEGGEVRCVGPAPGTEACGGTDEDCDGVSDEGGVCAGPGRCIDVACPPDALCVDGVCVDAEPCGEVFCPPAFECRFGRCLPGDPGDAVPIAGVGEGIQILGTLDGDDRQWQRLHQDCAQRLAGDYSYDAVRVINQTGAARSLTVTAEWGDVDGHLHAFTAGFDPASPMGCLAGDDDWISFRDSRVEQVAIAAGEVLVLVASTYDPGVAIPAYRLLVETLPGATPDELDCTDGLDDEGDGRVDCEEFACVLEPACEVVEGEPCENYVELNEASRSVMTLVGNACDQGWRNTPVQAGRWHRFVPPAGTRMPTEPPPTRRCGTDAPGWLEGPHPGVADGVVERRVCFHWQGDPCWASADVQVLDCGGFYIYRLPEAPECSLAYCAE